MMRNARQDDIPARPEGKPGGGFFRRILRLWRQTPLISTALVLGLMIVLQTVALGFDYPTFGAWFSAWGRNWLNILRNNATVGIVALGMTFVILSGGIDLAVGSALAAVGAVTMALVNANEAGLLSRIGITGVPAIVLGVAAALLAGAAIGCVNGGLIARSKIPPFIVTLGMMKICRSVTQYFMQSYRAKLPAGFRLITQAPIGGEIVLPILYWLALAVILHIVATRTPFGRRVYAIGSNERTARLSGIPVERIQCQVYVLMGVLVAVASVISIARIGSMDYANSGSGYEMDAIAAVVIGGTSMSGGKGSVLGTVMGMLILGVMSNLLNIINVNAFLVSAFKGVIVIAAVLLQRKERAGA